MQDKMVFSCTPFSEGIASQRLPKRFESTQVGLNVPYCELFGGKSKTDLSMMRHGATSRDSAPAGWRLFCYPAGGPGSHKPL